MKPLLPAVFLAGAIITAPAIAAAADWQPMQLLQIATTNPPPEIAAIWSDQIRSTNRAFAADVRPIQSATGNAPILIYARTFDVDGTKVIASVFHGWKANCQEAANSKGSDQTWADCPARVTTIRPSGEVKTVRTTACFNGFPLGPNRGAPPTEKTLASFDPATNRVSFRITNDGHTVRNCDRSAVAPK